MNSINDAYCCNCHRLKDGQASKDGELPSISTLTGLLSTHMTGYNTHDDDNHEHYKASSSSQLDFVTAFRVVTSVLAQDPHDGKWRRFWYCCNCGDGPHGTGNIPACSSCPHVQCTACEVVHLKQ